MLLKRIGYYLVGLSLGIVGVYFFWQKKEASFDYGMDSRTLKSIRTKKIIYAEEAQFWMNQNEIDTLIVNIILKNGDVDFGKGNPRQKPCAEYYITGKEPYKKINLYIKRCDSIATIQRITKN